jgi:hypothetical protein
MAGGELELEAVVVDQIGLPGALNQSFNWVALNSDRTAVVSGITVTPSADTQTATVTVDASVAPGTYNIVAMSSDYSGFMKAQQIVVEEATENISALALTNVLGTVTLAATVSNSTRDKIMFAIARYDGNQLISIDTKYVDVASGTASGEMKLDGVNFGNTVRSFIWSENLMPIANYYGFAMSLID